LKFYNIFSASYNRPVSVFTLATLYQSAIFGGFFISGTIPIFYELTIEQTYPVAEGTTTGLLTLINNIITVLFLGVFVIKNVGKGFLNSFTVNYITGTKLLCWYVP